MRPRAAVRARRGCAEAMNSAEQQGVLGELRRRGGAARVHELAATPHLVRLCVARGDLVRIERGCVALPDAARAFAVAAQQNGLVSCVSRLHLLGVQVPGDPDVVHVCVPAHRGHAKAVPDGVVRHHEDAQRDGELRATRFVDAVVRAVLCLVRSGTYDLAVGVVDQSLRRVAPDKVGAVRRYVLAQVARSSVALARALDDDIDPRARALRETEVRLVLRRGGLAVVPGLVIPTVGEVDMLVDGVLIAEIDGFAYHRDREPYRKDRRRDVAALDLTLLTHRYAWEDSDPLAVLARTRSRLVTMTGPLPFAEHVPDELRAGVEALRSAAVEPRNRVVGARHLTGAARTAVVWPA